VIDGNAGEPPAPAACRAQPFRRRLRDAPPPPSADRHGRGAQRALLPEPGRLRALEACVISSSSEQAEAAFERRSVTASLHSARSGRSGREHEFGGGRKRAAAPGGEHCTVGAAPSLPLRNCCPNSQVLAPSGGCAPAVFPKAVLARRASRAATALSVPARGRRKTAPGQRWLTRRRARVRPQQQDPSAPAARSHPRRGNRDRAASAHDARPQATCARDTRRPPPR
jgi:hypothetical protein